MPYKKKSYVKRPRTYRKKRVMRKRYQRARPELKHVDIALNDTTLGVTETITPLAVISTGSLENNRIGSKVSMQSLNFRGSVVQNAASITDIIELYIVRDKEATSTPVWTDVFTEDAIDSQINFDQTRRFKVLKHKRFNFTANGSAIKQFQFRVPLKFETRYEPSSTTVVDNNIFFMVRSKDNTSKSVMTWTSRVSYYDC